ncbi:HD domain-containing protein [Gynurincola endophyticus]|uniref:HD domain-containing protein n=1 Tax=Gynurincola endophyticus TaxID=2479004 RepID=UPI000F8E1EFC|nr:hypothetical protein [Gynurincola endophyticus]
MSEILEKIFYQLLSTYTENASRKDKCWNEIEQNYQQENRHYHNLSHLEQMIAALHGAEIKIKDYDTLLFSIFYHDIIYHPAASANEEQSAELAKRRLEELGLPVEQIEKVCGQIIATKAHQRSANTDTNYLLDADLAILGQAPEIYLNYRKQIRAEYSIYPDALFNAGRKKVLQQFLNFQEIFKTPFFKNKYESQARENLQRELDWLQHSS